nr:MAG TPA: hypothetical protein [Caudoviricetes sp.]
MKMSGSCPCIKIYMCYNRLEWKFKVLGNLRYNFVEAGSMGHTPDYQKTV